MVLRRVRGGVNQRHPLLLCNVRQATPILQMMGELVAIVLAETGKIDHFAVKGLAQFGGRGKGFTPLIVDEIFLFDAAWPQSINQNTVAVIGCGVFIYAFTL